MAKKKTLIIDVQTGQSVENIDELNSSLQNVQETTEETKKSMFETGGIIDGMTGGAISKFNGLIKSLKGVNLTLKATKVALISTGIGAIVVAVGTLAAAFFSTQEGADGLNSILTPLKVTMQVIWGVVQDLSKGFKTLLSGELIKGWEEMGKAIEGVGDKLEGAYENGKKLHELQLQIRNDEVNAITALSKLNIQKAKALSIAEDENKTAEARRKGFNDAIAAENAMAAVRDNSIAQRIEEIKLMNSFNDTSSEAYKEYIQLEADRERAEYDRLTATTALSKQLFAVKDEEVEVERKKVDAIETTYADYAIITEDGEKTVYDIREKWNQRAIDADKKAKDILIEAEKRLTAAKVDLQLAQVNAVRQGFAALSQLAEDNKAVQAIALVGQAAASIASTVIETQAANAIIIAEGAALAIPTAGASVAAAAALVTSNNISAGVSIGLQGLALGTGLAGLGKSGGGNVGGTGGTVSAPTSNVPELAPQFNVVGTGSSNQLAQSLASETTKPVKAYVVSTEMTSQQELDTLIENSSNF